VSMTESIIAFLRAIRNDELPEVASGRSVRAIVDCIGVAFAGARSPAAEMLMRVVTGSPSGGTSVVIGNSVRSNPLDAALINGTSAHALEFDDTTHPGPMHSSCHLVPVILALAPIAGASGDDCLKSYVAGLEIEGKLARAMNPSHYAAGWHSTSTIGTLGAAGAASLMLDLSDEETEMCLGIAASQAAGLRANFGSMTKPLHAGQAARAGVLASLLAKEGFDASTAIFDRRWNYLSTFGVENDLRLLDELGSPLEILNPDTLGLKPYPSCGEATSAIELALGVHGMISVGEIDTITVFTSTRAKSILVHSRPTTVEQARFSLEFCVASALISGRSDLATFSESTLRDSRVRELIDTIVHETDEALTGPDEFGCRLVIGYKDGSRIERSVMHALGWAERWLDDKQLLAKFEDCVALLHHSGEVRSLFDELLAMAELKSTDDLVSKIDSLSVATSQRSGS
jgi:2-methylcitrate dehydratase PrpD